MDSFKILFICSTIFSQVQAQTIFEYSNGNPDYSPDGSYVVFEGIRDGNRDIYIAKADGSLVRNLSNSIATEMHPSWTPDSESILFDSDRSGNSDIYIMAFDGSNVRRLTIDPAADLVGISSPDGTQIAFNSLRDGQWEVYLMDLETGGLQNLSKNPAIDIMRSWSEDGEKIQFDSDRDDNPGNAREAYTMNQDGSQQTRLTYNPADDRFLRRGPPDSNHIAFTSTRGTDGSRSIWLMNRDGTDQRLFYDGPGDNYFPSWSPNGETVIFYSTDGESGDLYKVDATGRGREKFLMSQSR